MYGICLAQLQKKLADELESLSKMHQPFDLIFVDLDFTVYRAIVEQILDRQLLSKNGVILVDNGTAEAQSSIPAFNNFALLLADTLNCSFCQGIRGKF